MRMRRDRAVRLPSAPGIIGSRLAGAMLALAMATSGVAAAPIVLAVTGASMETDVFSGRPTLQVELAPEAQRSFAKLTSRHVGEVIHLLIDGKVVASPRVQTVIVGPSLVISGDYTAKELSGLVRRLTDGEAVVAVDVAGR